ncbi:ATP-binding protein [Croceicoccus sp. F390]|uniref:histidine kinase n=1 Tax=Croceicoccus esteveae TaxID=3075597 RepID=A0ABU2ZGE7_9SPHN|nr:ATP-binding protein [Croceicoccus sp. F390]MDT0575163.1 ATP-binding protein [Croceicoccus sp. F390]
MIGPLMQTRPSLVPGFLLALAGACVTGWIARDFWLAAGILVVWAASLLLTRPPPDNSTATIAGTLFQKDRLRDFLEPLDHPYLVMKHKRVILANRAAREVLGGHIIDQDIRVALRHPAAVRLVQQEGGGHALIRGLTGPRSIWHIALLPIDSDNTMIELVNRTAEADITRAHTDFVANASHELRTPLASIIGYVETLVDSGAGAAPVSHEARSRFLKTVLREARRLQALVEDLMSLSRIEAEKHDLPSVSFDIGELAQTVVADMSLLAGAGRIHLTADTGPMLVRGDRQQIEQAMRNLVENALKYGSSDTLVAVQLTFTGSSGVEMCVTDKGAGIPPEHLPHLTRRFYRADPGRSRASGGTGLGLAIVKHIVERHRGTLDIRSTLGTGTTIRIVLAAARQTPSDDTKGNASRRVTKVS